MHKLCRSRSHRQGLYVKPDPFSTPYDYDPYGRLTKLSGTSDADFGFTGFYQHPASGLNLPLFRAYDADFGRWLSRDPLEESGGLNFYTYCLNNPINWIDPLGLELDVNLFPNEKHEGLNFFLAGQNMVSEPDNLLTIGGHANPISIVAANKKAIPYADLADIIRNTEKWKRGNVQKVRIIACELGLGDYGQNLANELNTPVEAPDTFAYYWKNGHTALYHKTRWLGKMKMNKKKPGHYILFNPK